MISTTLPRPARIIINGEEIAPAPDNIAPTEYMYPKGGQYPEDEVEEVYPDRVKFKTWGVWLVDVGTLPFPVRPGYKLKLITR